MGRKKSESFALDYLLKGTILLFLVFFSGCVYYSSLPIGEFENIQENKSKKGNAVELFFTNQNVPNYEVIGPISSNGGGYKATISALKNAAARIGGDAIIDFEMEFHHGYFMFLIFPIKSSSFQMNGIAVRLNDE